MSAAKSKKWKSKGPAFPKDCLPVAIRPVVQPESLFGRAISFLNPLRAVTQLENPDCVGILDNSSKSVWVVNSRDMDILWIRGYFGKGSLSRSEPTWLTRRINETSGVANGIVSSIC